MLKIMLPKGCDGATLTGMETSSNMDSTAAYTPLGQLTAAAREIDVPCLSALLAIFVGWFFLDTLTVSLGSLQHGVRFFDISSVIADPTRIFFGVDAPLRRCLFVLLLFACLLAPLLPHWHRSRPAWAAYLAPLALMVTCGALLYSRTSGEFFASPADPGSLGGSVVRFANHLVRQGSGLISRHVSIGAGGYLAFLGSVVLGVKGIGQLRRHAA